MKVVPKRKRLSVYKRALADYTAELRANKHGFANSNNLSCGLCFYFKKTHGIDIYDDGGREHILPELDAAFKRAIKGYYGTIAPDGELKPRIALLKRVIKKMES